MPEECCDLVVNEQLRDWVFGESTYDQVAALGTKVCASVNDDGVFGQHAPIVEKFIHPVATTWVDQYDHATVAGVHIAAQFFDFFWL